jgi:hypothetical protein
MRRWMGLGPGFLAVFTLSQAWHGAASAAEYAAEYDIRPAPSGSGAVAVIENRAVEPETLWALEWEMLVEGERAWRFRAPFAGVRFTFAGADGAAAGSIERHTHCYRTDGWRRTWALFRAPKGAATVSASFVIKSEDALPGHFVIRDPRLIRADTPPAPGPGEAVLRVKATDGSGRPVHARLYIQDAQGRAVVPPFAFDYTQADSSFFLQDLACNWVVVPPGAYTVRAVKGFEFAPARAEARVEEGESLEVELMLRRVFDWAADGWYAGDHHVHLFRHGRSAHPMMNIEDVYTAAKAEGLSFLPFMGEDRVAPEARRRVEPDFIGYVTAELTRDLWGHICSINVASWPKELPRHGEIAPMNVDWMRAAADAGGAIAYAHPYARFSEDTLLQALANSGRGHAARELPIALALGETFTLDMLTKEDDAPGFELKRRDYMRLLNLGFRAGVSGSTDFHLDQGRQPIGAARTYVHAGSLEWPAVARAYREGRTFATNGPLLRLDVAGKEPGDVVALPGPGSVVCRVEAVSAWGIEAVELWQDGQRVAVLDAQDGACVASRELPVERSGWVLAIARDPGPPKSSRSWKARRSARDRSP